MTVINFSALPDHKTPDSPWKAFRFAVAATGILLVVLGPIIILTDSDSGLQNVVLGGLQLVVITMLAMYAYRTVIGKIRKQRDVMRTFAEQNSWQFEGYIAELSDYGLLPAGWEFFSRQCRQLYRITGDIEGRAFELYVLFGFDSSTYLPAGFGRSMLAYRTVARTRYACSVPGAASFVQAVSEDGWNYILMNGNASTVLELSELLKPLNQPNRPGDLNE